MKTTEDRLASPHFQLNKQIMTKHGHVSGGHAQHVMARPVVPCKEHQKGNDVVTDELKRKDRKQQELPECS